MTKYSEEFRDESVRLVLESERSVAEAARELGISVWTLRGWVKKRRDGSRREQTRQGLPPRRETLEEDIRRLRREVSTFRPSGHVLPPSGCFEGGSGTNAPKRHRPGC